MYATIQEMTLQYGLTEIAQLLDDEDGNITDQLLQAHLDGDTSSFTADEQAAITRSTNRAEQIIQQQMVFINASVASRYHVPLTDGNARATPVHTCCMALARAAFADDSTNLSDQVAKDRDYWRAWLRDIPTGKVVLPGLTAVSDGSGTQQQRLTGQLKSSVDWGRY